MRKSVLLVSLLLVTLSSALDPASLKFYVSTKGVDAIQQTINPILISALHNVSLPDQEAGALGIEVYMTQMYLTNFTFGQQSVNFIDPNIVQIVINDISASLFMNWEYKDGPLIDFKGWAEDDISSTSVSVNIAFSGSNGRALLQVSDCSVSIGTLNINLHGDGGQFFQFIAKLITPILKKVAENAVQSAFESNINAILVKVMNSIPLSVPIFSFDEFYFGLIPDAPRGLSGTSYSNNHFSGDSSPVTYGSFDHISIGNYDSFDVSGYFQPPVSGQYSFHLSYTQRGQIDVNGQSAGGLEMHNPGMCWPEHSTANTGLMTMDSDQLYPIRLRYQSGCFGGWIEVDLCNSTGACSPLSGLNVDTAPTAETPIAVYPDYVILSSAAEIRQDGANSSNAPFPHHALPNTAYMTDRMFGITLDEFVINSLSYSVFTQGVLNWNRLGNPNLNTTVLRYMLPDLYAHFPNEEIFANISFNAPPTVTFSSSKGLSVDIPISLNLSVFSNGTFVEDVIDLHVDISASAQIAFNGNNVTGQVSSALFQLSLVESKVQFNATQMQFFFNALLNGYLPLINQRLEQGFPIPSLGFVALSNPSVSISDNFIMFASDLASSLSFSDSFFEDLYLLPTYISKFFYFF